MERMESENSEKTIVSLKLSPFSLLTFHFSPFTNHHEQKHYPQSRKYL
jgi:hypothetical protein